MPHQPNDPKHPVSPSPHTSLEEGLRATSPSSLSEDRQNLADTMAVTPPPEPRAEPPRGTAGAARPPAPAVPSGGADDDPSPVTATDRYEAPYDLVSPNESVLVTPTKNTQSDGWYLQTGAVPPRVDTELGASRHPPAGESQSGLAPSASTNLVPYVAGGAAVVAVLAVVLYLMFG
ncbi:MAG: hypothetical protein ABMB14_16295 [Myxococcota bacterium]